jgi:hypothetical protein
MLTKQEKIQRLEDCIALLEDVDAMQQAVFGACDSAELTHTQLQDLIAEFEDDIEDIRYAE